MFRKITILLLAVMVYACSSDNDNAEPTVNTFTPTATINVTLTGDQQTPILDTNSSATASIEYNDNQNLIRVRLNTANIANFNGARLVFGNVGENGDVQFNIQAGEGSVAELFSRISGTQLQQLIDGEMYIEALTTDNPAGDIRAQIVNANVTVFGFQLNGSQEVPSVRTQATGDGYVVYNSTTQAFYLRVNTADLDDATMAHVHTGRVGNNGPVLVALESDTQNVWETPSDAELSTELFGVLANGGHYLNVHTTRIPSGEIRGQIVPNNFDVLTFALNGAQEVPYVKSMASGYGYALVNTSTFDFETTVVTMGVEDAVAAHIHTGRVGTNGPVLVGLEQSENDANVWSTPADTALDADILAVLLSGGHYVNVHTPEVASGEIRGQITTDNLTVAAFMLDGAQEVPSVRTEAMGSGYALINSDNFDLELRVLTQGVDDAVAAHIHTGRIGINGGVLVGLEQDEENVQLWATPADTGIDQEILNVLLSGGHYVNVHTPAVASGEIRGQILTPNYTLGTFGLDGAQEVPSIMTDANGDGYLLIDDYMRSVEVRVVTTGVEDAVMGHIHTGRVGLNGPVLVGLEQSAEDVNVWATPEGTVVEQDILDVLKSGGHYVNIHTPSVPSGEIRGQILTNQYALVTFNLDGRQEVPAVITDASGDGYALVNMYTFALEVQVLTEGVSDATMAHIHTGRVGSNGPVLVGLEQAQDDPNRWSTAADTAIDADILAVLLGGGHYVNVHTPSMPSGEIRGQILTNDYTLFTFVLGGDQEVPPVETDADGDGYVLVNRYSFDLDVVVITRGVEDANAAHIHVGEAGTNGPVLAGLLQSEDNVNMWMSAEDLTIDADILEMLLNAGHYINVHTPANPSGEIRGQIE